MKSLIVLLLLVAGAGAQHHHHPEYVVVVNCIDSEGKAAACEIQVSGEVRPPGKKWRRLVPGTDMPNEHFSPVTWHINIDRAFKLRFTSGDEHKLSLIMFKMDGHGASTVAFRDSGHSVYVTNRSR